MFYKNIQIMRGVASLLVLFVHLLATAPGIVPWVIQTGSNVIGPAGVDIFFVISGFVVTLSALKASEKNSPIKQSASFIFNRIIRIYPVYLVVLLVSFMVPSAVELSPEWLPRASLIELITLTYPYNYKIMAAWTLTYEMFFYCVLALIILFSSKRFSQSLIIWIGAEAVLIFLTYLYNRNLFGYIPLNPQIMQFAAGCIIALLSKKIIFKKGKEVLSCGLILFIIMCCVNIKIANWEPLVRTLTLTIPCAMIIYGCVAIDNKSKLPFEGVFLWFGKISFSLYLVHQLTFQTGYYWFRIMELDKVMGGYLMLFSILGMAIGLGTSMYYLVEKPCLSIIKSRKSNKQIALG